MDQELLLEISSKFLSSESLRLLKINLEMETFAPKFEAISQFQPSPDENCKTFIEYQSGVFACSLKELEGKDLIGVTKGSFDYVKQENNPEMPLIRIYTVAGSETFYELFDYLLEKGFNVAVQLLVKPKNCPFYQEEVLPTGYGLEFELKSSNYVVEEPQEELPDDNEEVEFDNSQVLKAFKDIKEVEQIQGKALSSLKKEDSLNFNDILKVSTNIPIISDKIKNLKPERHQLNSKQSQFRINNFDLKSANVDPFRLLDFMNIYTKISNELKRLTNGNFSVLKKILKSSSSHSSQGSSGIRYNIKTESLTFLNDLEKDKRYSNWPKEVDETVIEEGKFSSKNVLTVIIPINFDNRETTTLLENLIQMVSYGYPIRFAILPVIDESSKDNLKPWIKAYYAVRESYGLRASVSFLRNSLAMYQNDPENSKNLIEFLISQLNLNIKIDSGEELANEAEITCKKFKITNESFEVFLNGLSTPITQNLAEIMMNQYRKEFELILNNENLKNSDNFYESILKEYKAKNERLSIDEEIRYKNDHLLPIESMEKLLSIQNYYGTTDE